MKTIRENAYGHCSIMSNYFIQVTYGVIRSSPRAIIDPPLTDTQPINFSSRLDNI